MSEIGLVVEAPFSFIQHPVLHIYYRHPVSKFPFALVNFRRSLERYEKRIAILNLLPKDTSTVNGSEQGSSIAHEKRIKVIQ